MYKHQNEEIYHPKTLLIWFMLASQGGFLNVAGFIFVKKFVSHLTGFATLAGNAFSLGNYRLGFEMLMVPIFYLLGTMFTAIFTEKRRIEEKSPRYFIIFSTQTALLFSIWMIGILNFWNHHNTFSLLALLSIICGIQNAAISSSSNSIIRTTHLTGPTTDLGIGIIRLWSMRKRLKFHDAEVRMQFCRMGLIFFFTLGSFIGAVLINHFSYHAFAVPAFFTLLLTIYLKTIKKL